MASAGWRWPDKPPPARYTGAVKFALACLALILSAPAAATRCDALWHDGPRGRDVPVRIDMPAGEGRVPAVLWSPGLGGGRGSAERWTAAWTAAGIAVIRLEHPGTDGAVYAGPRETQAERVRAAVTPEQLVARIADVGFVADELARRGQEGGCALTRIDTDRLALGGHSMGAWVAQAMAGEQLGGIDLADRRFRAFLLMSSTGPADAAQAAARFAGIGRPLLVITGTLDGTAATAPPAAQAEALAMRTAPFTGAPADGRKALLVVGGASHMLFAGDRRSDAGETAMQDRVAAISTAWWRHWLLGEAAPVLDRPALAPGDRWQRK